jgi:AcrR family transcriptional regulator
MSMSRRYVASLVSAYAAAVPRLWDDTISAHRQAVREAVLATTWRLVSEHGALSVTMSQVAEEAGIGRATLYRYFSDVEEILHAWHERHVAAHLAELRALGDQPGSARGRLRAVMQGYAEIVHHQGEHGSALTALLHRDLHASQARDHLATLFTDLLAQAVEAGEVRSDVPARELATFCLHALEAAREFRRRAAVRRVVDVTFAALRRHPPTD